MKSEFRDGDTVGTTYRNAQKESAKGLLVGDINTGMVNSLVEDLNNSFESDPFEGRPFYVNVVEQRDLIMKNAIKRRMIKSLYRPFPEGNTLVFHVTPKTNEILYCWDLPHHSELPNILIHAHLYDHDYITNIQSWKRGGFEPFGFMKVSIDRAQIEGYDEKKIDSYRKAYLDFCAAKGMSEKSVAIEKQLGFFWIPNRFHQDKELKSKFSLII